MLWSPFSSAREAHAAFGVEKGPTFMEVISAGHELCAQFRLLTLFCAIVCVAIATAHCAHIASQ